MRSSPSSRMSRLAILVSTRPARTRPIITDTKTKREAYVPGDQRRALPADRACGGDASIVHSDHVRSGFDGDHGGYLVISGFSQRPDHRSTALRRPVREHVV